MDSEDLLAQLADIHLPEPVSFWPPAPGWWVLGVLLLVLAGVGIHYLIQASHRRKIGLAALAELDRCYEKYASADGDPDELRLRYVNEFNSVLRRVALVHFPHANVASLGGAAWVDFIQEKGDSKRLDEDIANALSYGRFQTKCEVDVEAMNRLGQDWIRSLYDRPPAARSEQQELIG